MIITMIRWCSLRWKPNKDDKWWNLSCKLDKGTVVNFIHKIEEGYLQNPYHNKVDDANAIPTHISYKDIL